MSLCLFALRASSEPYTSNDSGRLVHQLESPSLQTQAASKWKLSLVTVPSAYVLSHFSHVWLFVTLWTIAHQAPPSLGFSRQEYWSGLPFPSPGDLLDLQIQPKTFTSPEGGHGNPLQYSCLDNPMDSGAWWATVHGVAKSQTWLKWLSTYAVCGWGGSWAHSDFMKGWFCLTGHLEKY